MTNALDRRLSRLEGEKEEVVIVSFSNDGWPEERMRDESMALALAAGLRPPFRFVHLIERFGDDGPTTAELVQQKEQP